MNLSEELVGALAEDDRTVGDVIAPMAKSIKDKVKGFGKVKVATKHMANQSIITVTVSSYNNPGGREHWPKIVEIVRNEAKAEPPENREFKVIEYTHKNDKELKNDKWLDLEIQIFFR